MFNSFRLYLWMRVCVCVAQKVHNATVHDIVRHENIHEEETNTSWYYIRRKHTFHGIKSPEMAFRCVWTNVQMVSFNILLHI